jgi:hypothetical protein
MHWLRDGDLSQLHLSVEHTSTPSLYSHAVFIYMVFAYPKIAGATSPSRAAPRIVFHAPPL